MKKISTRFALLMAAAAVVPLIAYGVVSMLSLRAGSQRTVIQGNQDVARRVGYDSEEAFSRAFKRACGLAPAHWRAERP